MSTISARGSKAASQPASATLSPVVLFRETGYTCSGGGGGTTTTTIIVQFKSQLFLFSLAFICQIVTNTTTTLMAVQDQLLAPLVFNTPTLKVYVCLSLMYNAENWPTK